MRVYIGDQSFDALTIHEDGSITWRKADGQIFARITREQAAGFGLTEPQLSTAYPTSATAVAIPGIGPAVQVPDTHGLVYRIWGTRFVVLRYAYGGAQTFGRDNSMGNYWRPDWSVWNQWFERELVPLSRSADSGGLTREELPWAGCALMREGFNPLSINPQNENIERNTDGLIDQLIPIAVSAALVYAGAQAVASFGTTAGSAATTTTTTTGSSIMDESLSDIMGSTGNVPEYAWDMTYDATIADGMTAANQLAASAGTTAGTAAGAKAGTSSLSDLLSGVTSTIKTGIGAVTALAGTKQALSSASATPQNRPPSAQAGSTSLGAIALAAVAFFALRG